MFSQQNGLRLLALLLVFSAISILSHYHKAASETDGTALRIYRVTIKILFQIPSKIEILLILKVSIGIVVAIEAGLHSWLFGTNTRDPKQTEVITESSPNRDEQWKLAHVEEIGEGKREARFGQGSSSQFQIERGSIPGIRD
jgi:hypothetical protein